ncbi:MAG TPA: M23 family metallopeptidase [Bacteroidia bacterium]|jgi:hypothetical protein|nr:M23 family metallopeptidase [Bacteroidia bacterium]
MLLRTLSLIYGFCVTLTISAQDYPQNYFRNPLDIPVSLAGNFGEIRPNHFHAGLDLKTGQEGLKVHAAADGYVSRIKVSPTGYGKVVYITHPNGYVTVYGHLSRFSGALTKYARDAQYSNENYEIELFPKEGELPVSKGDIIALSGNTGNSGGPHVHFEIRDAKTEYPINPLLFGLNVPDTVKPVIRSLVIYPIGPGSRVNNSNKPLHIIPGGGKKQTEPAPIVLSGSCAFGIQTNDRENKSGENQVYSIEVQCDGKTIYRADMKSIGFSESRFVNAYADFSEKKTSGQTIQRCFLIKNNPLGIYKDVADSGRISLKNDGSKHTFRFIVKDFPGNSRTAELVCTGGPAAEQTLPMPACHSCFQPFSFRQPDILQVEIPAGAMYEDYVFVCVPQSPKLHPAYTTEFRLMNETVPLQDNITLRLKTTGLDSVSALQAVVVKEEKNGSLSSFGGTWSAGWMTVQTKEFGTYGIVLDKTPPALSLTYPAAVKNGRARLVKGKQIQLSVSDNLSGLKSYRAAIDGKWVLMEYEPKQKRLSIDTDDAGIFSGEHELEVEAMDGVKNKSVIRFNFLKE